jgi:hypothetical protein
MLVRLVHVENAQSPILVTPLGMVMLLSLVHSVNAPLPIMVTLIGMVKGPRFPDGYWKIVLLFLLKSTPDASLE